LQSTGDAAAYQHVVVVVSRTLGDDGGAVADWLLMQIRVPLIAQLCVAAWF